LKQQRRAFMPPPRFHAAPARRQGSVHLPVWRRLVQAAAEGKLAVLEGWEVASAEPPQAAGSGSGGAGWVLHLRRCSPAEARYKRPPPGLSTFQQAVAAATASAAAGGNASPASAAGEPLQAAVPLTAQGKPSEPVAKPVEEAHEQVLAADEVWLACGRAHNASADPVLRKLAAAAPLRIAGGYAWPDDEHLCWPGAPVYLAGRAAMLSLGPAAGGRLSVGGVV
jgi:hypothetical protein